jgi:hypothetical protein
MIEGRDEYDRRRVRLLGERFDHLEAASVTHFDVQQHDIWGEDCDLGKRFPATARFANLLGIRDCLKQQRQASQRQGFIVHGEDSKRAHRISSGKDSVT